MQSFKTAYIWVHPKPNQIFRWVAQSEPSDFGGTQISFVKSEVARLDDSRGPFQVCYPICLVQDFLEGCSGDSPDHILILVF